MIRGSTQALAKAGLIIWPSPFAAGLTAYLISSATVVTIDRDAQVFLGDKPVNIHDLPEKLRSPGTDPAKRVIYLRADERVPFGAFASLMDAVKQAGITNISIVTQPLDTKGRQSGGQ